MPSTLYLNHLHLHRIFNPVVFNINAEETELAFEPPHVIYLVEGRTFFILPHQLAGLYFIQH